MCNLVLGFLTSKVGIIVIVGAVIGGLWIWNRHLSAELHAAEAKAASYERTIEVLEETAKEKAERSAETNKVKEEIENAPDSEDGDIAPVTQRALDLLRSRNSSR